MLFGFVFSRFEKKEKAERILLLKSSAFVEGLKFITIFNASVLLCYIVSPDWMWMYFLETARVPLWGLIYLFLTLYYLPYIAGFLLGLETRDNGGWWKGSLICLAAEGLIVALLWERYSKVGTLQEFRSGSARNLFGEFHAVSAIMNVAVVISLVYFVWIWLGFRKEASSTKPSI